MFIFFIVIIAIRVKYSLSLCIPIVTVIFKHVNALVIGWFLWLNLINELSSPDKMSQLVVEIYQPWWGDPQWSKERAIKFGSISAHASLIHWSTSAYPGDLMFRAAVNVFGAWISQWFHLPKYFDLKGLIHDTSAGWRNGVMRFGMFFFLTLAAVNVLLTRWVMWQGAWSYKKFKWFKPFSFLYDTNTFGM